MKKIVVYLTVKMATSQKNPQTINAGEGGEKGNPHTLLMGM